MLNDKEIEILDLIEQDISYQNYFFKKAKNLKWFFPLKGKGYFDPDKAPSQTEPDEKGYFTIPQWNVLPYLERISQQVNTPDNEKYIDELLDIIRKVTGVRKDNYRTWWFFVKILLNIPNEKIPLEIIELIPVWLDSDFDTNLQGSDIATKLLPKFFT
jgi:hypothetical protein